MIYRTNQVIMEIGSYTIQKDEIVIGMDEKIPFGYVGTYPFLTRHGSIVYLYSDEFDRL